MLVQLWKAVEKRPSAALRLSFVIAAYGKVRLIPHDFARLASNIFEQPVKLFFKNLSENLINSCKLDCHFESRRGG